MGERHDFGGCLEILRTSTFTCLMYARVQGRGRKFCAKLRRLLCRNLRARNR